MAIAYLNRIIEIPGIVAMPMRPVTIRDRDYTAGGVLRQDLLGGQPSKRAWTIDCPRLTKAQYDAIINHLTDAVFCKTLFWTDDVGGDPASDSIEAWVRINHDERRQFGAGGAWQHQGRRLTLEVIEA